MLTIDRSCPKISCLLVTGDGRIDYVKQSFKCYCDQTYPNKELVVVTDGSYEYKKQIQEMTKDRNDVCLIFLNGRYTLGALRNISIYLCTGDVFVQWDDDDFNMPDRIMIQYNWMHKSGKMCCYLSDQLHYYFPTKELYWENWWEFHSGFSIKYGLIPGTLMAYKKDFSTRYPSSGVHARAGEDSVLSNALSEQGNITLLKKFGNLQVYSYHGNNVWDIQHHSNISKHRSHDIQFMNENKEKIIRTLKYMNFSDTVRVMGRNGLAFIYEAKHVD